MALVIKENCWKWDSSKGPYFMKYYEDLYVAQKVKLIHTTLEKIQFPYHVRAEINEDAHILKQRWFEGKSADYRKLEDQELVLTVLQALHETRYEIDWFKQDLLPFYHLKEKWIHRLARFIENENPLTELLQGNYKKIVSMAENALSNMNNLSSSKSARTLIHGDVVHHNFMIGEDGIKLVDFDLAAVGEYTDELILWIHRVLPNVSYNLEALMYHHPYLQEAKHKFQYLKYPNELMREALFYLKCNTRQQMSCYPFIQSLVRETIEHEQQLNTMIDRLQYE